MSVELPPDNVTELPMRKKAARKQHLTMAMRPGACRHVHTQIDVEKSELLCLDCKEKLNPIQWLAKISTHERNAFENIKEWRALAQSIKDKCHTKCRYCGKMTPIRTNLSEYRLRELGEKIEKDGAA